LFCFPFQCQLAQMPDDIKLESLCLLAKIYTNQNQLQSAISFLQQAYDLSSQQPYWHCRIIFQIIVNFDCFFYVRFLDFCLLLFP